MSTFTFFTCIACTVTSAAFAQSSSFKESNSKFKDYTSAIHKNINLLLKDQKTGLYFETTDSIQKENPHSWLWPLCAFVQAANEMEL
ncbi:hypothetical protein H9X96_02170 [Pedobacter sp. N36a]|uniref:hypothetical protein n=1 Tax=Pedobacter sp. N36a TaxID=2767996 RepID=UPI001656ACF3|nr:hypothetical protein [Pedobacter sp. N36a]MBC8984580.1 hypothetical protein [Pedobacter sp. N36a]